LDNAFIADRLLNLIVLVLSLTVHEYFHAWTAWRLGDDTAARMGRLTLNPIPHIDLIGTILLPLLGQPIGWAKPVPVQPSRFRQGIRMSTGDILVSVAGPLSNLALATISAVVLGLLLHFAPGFVGRGDPARAFLGLLVLVNCSLAVFNILPVPPLDGSHVAGHFVPYRWRSGWDRFSRVAPLLLLVLLYAENWTRTPLLSRVLNPPIDLLVGALDQVISTLAA